jgi:hypothetical protein
VPDAPFIVETFCMGDHGVIVGYRHAESGEVEPLLQSRANLAAEQWGMRLHRSTIYAFCDALDGDLNGEARPLIHEVMNAFWVQPTRAEANAWGSYPYDSDPAGTAVRPLARPFTARDAWQALIRRAPPRGDRAWLPGSVAMSSHIAGIAVRCLAASGRDDGRPPAD